MLPKSTDRQARENALLATYLCGAEVSFYAAWEEGIFMKKTNIRKLCMSAFLTALAVVGSLFSFPFLGAKCSPVQHMVNIISGVYLGPWWAMGTAFCASLIRNIFGIGSLMAFPGSMVGAFLSGAMFHWVFKSKTSAVSLAFAYAGELFGTSVLGAMLAYPIAYFIMGNKQAALLGFVFPFFVSCIVGTAAAAVLVTALKNSKALDKFLAEGNRKARTE